MNRRDFIRTLGALPAAGAVIAPALAEAAASGYRNLLVLVELKGGNDGLNTVIPFADAGYRRLRPRLAMAREQVLQLDETRGLHPSLAPLMPIWEARQLAIVQGVGYPQANLSHFRSIEIWDTASRSDQYLNDGWLARNFARAPAPVGFAADGVVIGSPDMGPLAGEQVRSLALADPERFRRQVRPAGEWTTSGGSALGHLLKVQQDIGEAARKLDAGPALSVEFPAGAFGSAVRNAAQVVATRGGTAAIRLTLGGFDTHANQLSTQARLLGELAAGLASLRAALIELGRWDSTLIMTYAEFGRRPQENGSAGTDHGTANAHFVLGGRVRGGLYGEAPRFDRLDGNGNLPFAVDFRALYATALERWWGVDSRPVLGSRFAPLDLIA